MKELSYNVEIRLWDKLRCVREEAEAAVAGDVIAGYMITFCAVKGVPSWTC